MVVSQTQQHLEKPAGGSVPGPVSRLGRPGSDRSSEAQQRSARSVRAPGRSVARLEAINRRLARELCTGPAFRRFDDARGDHAALRTFRGPLAVVDFLHHGEPRFAAARSDVTRALIALAQERRSSLWNGLLLRAFFPALLRIRRGIGPNAGVTPADVDLLVLESFLEIAATLPLTTQGRLAVINLVLGTRKAIFRHLRAEALHAAPLLQVDFPDMRAYALSAEHVLRLGHVQRLLDPEHVIAWVRALTVSAGASEEDLNLLLGTHAAGVPLVTYVRRLHPAASLHELLRHIERCRRRRSRLLARLRDAIRHDSVSRLAMEAALSFQEVTR